MRSMLVVSLALLPPFLAAVWMRIQAALVESEPAAWPRLDGVPRDD